MNRIPVPDFCEPKAIVICDDGFNIVIGYDVSTLTEKGYLEQQAEYKASCEAFVVTGNAIN